MAQEKLRWLVITLYICLALCGCYGVEPIDDADREALRAGSPGLELPCFEIDGCIPRRGSGNFCRTDSDCEPGDKCLGKRCTPVRLDP